MTEQTTLPWLLSDYVIACIDRQTEAQHASRRLREAGFHAEDVQLVKGKEVIKRVDTACDQCNFAIHLLRLLWLVMTDEGVILQDYVDEARAGHNLLAIHVTDSNRLHEVRRILHEHHAHRVEYWDGSGTITQLLP